MLFVGSAFGIEARVIPQTALRLPRRCHIRGLRGRGWRGALGFAVAAAGRASPPAWRILGAVPRRRRRSASAATPRSRVVVAAWLRRVPSVLLEQNAHPGLANRALGHLARRVCTTFAEANAYFPAGKVVLTGNPVRAFAARRRRRRATASRCWCSAAARARTASTRRWRDAARGAVRGDPRSAHRASDRRDRREAVAARYAALGVAAEVLRVHRRHGCGLPARRPGRLPLRRDDASPSSPRSASRRSWCRTRSPPTTISAPTPSVVAEQRRRRLLLDARAAAASGWRRRCSRWRAIAPRLAGDGRGGAAARGARCRGARGGDLPRGGGGGGGGGG